MPCRLKTLHFPSRRQRRSPAPRPSFATMPLIPQSPLHFLLPSLYLAASLLPSPSHGCTTPRSHRSSSTDRFAVHLWPLPKIFLNGDEVLYVATDLTLELRFHEVIPPSCLKFFERYKDLIFTQREKARPEELQDLPCFQADHNRCFG